MAETGVAPVSEASSVQRVGSARIGHEDLVSQRRKATSKRAANLACADDADIHDRRRRPDQAGASIGTTLISFLLTNSWMPSDDSSCPYPDFLTPPNGRSALVHVG